MQSSVRLIALMLALGAAGAARAQAVDVATLAAPDAFTTPGRDTGLPANLWRGASIATARTVLPLLAAKPLTPAGQQLARRVLATGAPGPTGAGSDPALLAVRASALSATGDPKAAAVLLARAPGRDRTPELARAAAESELLAGQDAQACATEEGLSAGRDDIYWLRLRAYCQAIDGKAAQAQLTFELAQNQSRDAVFGRLMAVKLAGGGDPGAASLRNGLDFALSRNLGLNLEAAKPAPAVAAALAGGDPNPPTWDLTLLDPALAGLAGAMVAGQTLPAGGVSALIAAAAEADAKSRSKVQGQALLVAALAGDLAPQDRASLAAFTVPEGKAPAARSLALEDAARRKMLGETALLALWTLADAGTAGPAVADRARIVHALALAGLTTEARALTVEGLLAAK
ncbi:MAG: hypothetical protein ACREE0_14865 [Phenylobacterium sp.]